MAQSNRQEVSDYYANFRSEEKNLKLNVRHYQVFSHLLDAGLKKTDRILEIGCGFGTITSLMAKYISSGSIVATDISVERIEACRRAFKGNPKVEFVITDMTDYVPKEKFDFIVLPDVLEHIPLEAHPELFKLISSVLKEHGKILIHIPHPFSISYFRKHKPEALQIIDQSVHTDLLSASVYPAGLVIHSLMSYQLSNDKPDYQIIQIRKRNEYNSLSNISVNAIRWKKLKLRMRFFFAKIF